MAYESNALSALCQRVLRELFSPEVAMVIPNANFDSAAATSVTSANMLRNSNWNPTKFSAINTVIHRMGSATAADNERYAGDLTTTSGALSHTGANYADTTVGTEDIELWPYGLRRSLHIIPAVNRALRDVFFPTYVALSHIGDADGDMANSATTSWTASAGTTLSKVTTSTKLVFSQRGLRNVNTIATAGAQGTAVPMTTSRVVSAWAIAAATVDTATLKITDVTNTSTLDSVSSSELQPQLLQIPWVNNASTTKSVRLDLTGDSSSADITWNAAWLYIQDNLRVPLPAYVSEHYKAPRIYHGIPMAASATNMVYPASSMELVPLTEDRDYHLVFNQADANPYMVQFHDFSAFNWPLLVEARRPWIDLTTSGTGLATEAETTNAPLNQLIPRIKLEILDTALTPSLIGDKEWMRLHTLAQRQWDRANIVRPVAPVSHPRPVYSGWTNRT